MQRNPLFLLIRKHMIEYIGIAIITHYRWYIQYELQAIVGRSNKVLYPGIFHKDRFSNKPCFFVSFPLSL